MADRAEHRCNGCTACCTLLAIPPLNKEVHETCVHCVDGVGCGIRERRPVCCRKFFCLWVANPKFPAELRPDKCGVLFEPGGDHVILASVYPGRPESWHQGIARAFIEKCLRDGYAVIVQVEGAKHTLVPEGQSPASVWRRAADDARQRGFI